MMPIIKTRHSMEDGLVSLTYEKDKFKIVHAQDVMPIAENCYEIRKNGNNGWAKDKSFRLIARIPTIAFFDKKELTNPDGTVNEKEMKKYLKSPEGEMFKTVEKGI